MNKLRLLHFFVATLCLISFTSCDNDDDAEPSQQALLTAGEWQGASVYLNGADSTQFFRTAVDFDVNELSYRFDDNGEYRQIYDPVPTILGSWELSGTDPEVIIFDRGETYQSEATIIDLTATELRLQSNKWFGSQSPPVEIVYTRP